MLPHAFYLLLQILYFMLPLLSVSKANSNVYVQCSQLNFTSTTPYESNVNSLLASLIDSASRYNFNKFETSPQTNVVYGLFQCRGDLSSSNCEDCVAKAVSQLKTACPTSIGGEIQLDGCFVKYDDTSFFGVQEKVEVCRKCGPSIGYNSDVSNHIDGSLAFLVGGNGEYFRTGDFRSIKGLAQCVQDLSLSDCQDCLLEASGRLRSECETSTWADMYLGKCYIRYSEQGNYLDIPDDDSNPTSDNKKRKGKKKTPSWWQIPTSILGGGLSFYFTINCSPTIQKIAIFNNIYKNEIKELEYKKEAVEAERDSTKREANAAKEKVEKVEKIEKKINTKHGLPPCCCFPPPPPGHYDVIH